MSGFLGLGFQKNYVEQDKWSKRLSLLITRQKRGSTDNLTSMCSP